VFLSKSRCPQLLAPLKIIMGKISLRYIPIHNLHIYSTPEHKDVYVTFYFTEL